MRSLPNRPSNHPLFGPTGGNGLQGDGDGSHVVEAPRAVSTPRSSSALPVLKLMMKAFGGDVTTPALVEVKSPDQVAPLKTMVRKPQKHYLRLRKIVPTAQQRAYFRFLSSQIRPDVIKLPHYVKIMITIVCGFSKCGSSDAVSLIVRFMIVLTALMLKGCPAHWGAILSHTYPSPACRGFLENTG